MAEAYDTTMGGGNRQFPRTEWTRLHNPMLQEALMAELYDKYWKPLYTYLRCKGFPNERAKDLVQGFFTDKILGQDFLARADRAKGRFRNFLMVAIRNYAINVQKKEKSISELNEHVQKSSHQDPDIEFNRLWAEQVLQEVLKELELECKRKDKFIHWEVFREWLLEPSTESNHGQMGDICKKYNIEDTSKAYNMISNVKKRFRAILRRCLRSQVQSKDDVDAEITDFLNIFSKNTAR